MTTVNDLILRAFLMLEIWNKQQPVQPSDTTFALDILNQMLQSSPTSEVIPYNSQFSFNLTANKKVYEISQNPSADFKSSKIIQLNYANIILNSVYYHLDIFNRYEYFDTLTAINVTSIPNALLVQNQNDKTLLTFYPVPGSDFTFEMVGKFMLPIFSLNSVISNIPLEYYDYITFKLAKRLKMFYPASHWDENKEKEYREITASIEGGLDHDYTVRVEGRSRQSYWNVIYAGLPT